MKTLNSLSPEELKSKIVLFRVDYNLPMQDGKIQDDTRLVKTLSTLRFLMEAGAKIIIVTHLGRPKGEVNEELRLDAVAKHLEGYLGTTVLKSDEVLGEESTNLVENMEDGAVLMLENVRFAPEEKKNDPEFAKELAGLADLYVTDAFGVCHRAHASTVGVTEHLPSYAGFLLQKEVKYLNEILESPEQPFCLIVGGAKIDTKIGVLERFLDLADSFLIGGAMANTFLAAQGHNVGGSLYQEDRLDMARDFLKKAEGLGKKVLLPDDVMVSTEISENAEGRNVQLQEVMAEDKILDIGIQSTERYINELSTAKTIVWNGPMGLYEFAAFENGTHSLAKALAALDARVIIGGGDSIDAINKFKIAQDEFTHISTGGGAMLEFLEGKELPGIQVLAE